MASLATLMMCSALWFMAFSQTVQGKKLVVSTLLVPPFLSVKEYLKDGEKAVSYEGYISDLLDEVVKYTDTPYEFSVRRDGKFGHPLRNGSWDGLIGDVVDGRADLAAGPLTETSLRSKAVDFSTPFMNFGPVVVLKRPQPPVMTLGDRIQRLFSPLSQSIWMISGLAWFVTSFVLYLICHTNPYEWRRLARDRHATIREGESFTCANTFWFTTSSILLQGYTRAPRSLGGRVVVTFWWVYVLIFAVMYIASMTNYLQLGPLETVSTSYTSIQKIEDLGQQDDVGYGVLKEGATEQYLLSAKIATIKKVWATITQQKSYSASLDSAINKVRSSKRPFAFIAESAMARYFTKQRPCDIYMVGDFVTIGSYALAFPPNSSLVKRVDIALLIMREKGFLKELEDRWFSGECTGSVVESNSNIMQIPPFHEVDLATFSGALLILCIGLIIGGLASVTELLVFKYAEKNGKKDITGHDERTTSTVKGQTEANKQPEQLTKV